MRRTTLAQRFTGHRGSLGSVAHWVMESYLVLFFWRMKVMVMLSAKCRLGSSWGIVRRRRRNWMLPISTILVFRSPLTLLYSQERQAKKKAPPTRSAMCLFFSRDAVLMTRRRILAGAAFCCLILGSHFLWALIWPRRR